MSLSFGWPLGLLALLSLLIPVLLHLARRSTYPPHPFAALRWLQQRLRPRARMRLSEWLLLVLRLLLLLVLALLLARPLLHDVVGTPQPVIALSPALDAVRSTVLDGAPPQARRVWLAPGFPELDDAAAPIASASPASLLRELDQTLPSDAALTVVVPALLDGMDAQRPHVSRAVAWQVVDHQPAATPAPAAAAALPPLWLYADTAHQPQLRWGHALQRAWDQTPRDALPADVSAQTPPTGAVAMWLSSTAPGPALRTWVNDGGRLMLSSTAPMEAALPWADALSDVTGRVVLQQARQGHGVLLRWTVPLDASAIPMLQQPELPAQLRDVLTTPPQARRARAADMSPLHDEGAWPAPARDPAPWLLLLAALLFLLERLLASAPRRRGGTP